MKYEQKSFTVPASGAAPVECKHGWIDWKRTRCVLCGSQFVGRTGVELIDSAEVLRSPND